MFPLGDLFLFFVVDSSEFLEEFIDVVNVALSGFESVLGIFEFFYFDEDVSFGVVFCVMAWAV